MKNNEMRSSADFTLAAARKCTAGILSAILLGSVAAAEQVTVRHPQGALHQFMDARSEEGKLLGRVELTQSVQGDDVTMRLIYRFLDGSVDDETTTYRQQGTFRLVRDHHIQKGPFFLKPVDFTVEAETGTAITRTTDKNGAIQVRSEHMDLPADLSNGFIGTLLVNVQPKVRPFQVSLLVPLNWGRLIHVQISPEGEMPFQMGGRNLKATVFRIHPDLGHVVGPFARLIGIQPKDVMVWVLEGKEPAVVRIFGQLGGSGPVISSELEGTRF